MTSAPGGGNKYIGYTTEDIQITIYLDNFGNVRSAFPEIQF
jgi:hypothetical protein